MNSLIFTVRNKKNDPFMFTFTIMAFIQSNLQKVSINKFIMIRILKQTNKNIYFSGGNIIVGKAHRQHI